MEEIFPGSSLAARFRDLNFSGLPDGIASDQGNKTAVQDALSNIVLLRNIFLFMDDEDLVRIRRVSKYWRTVADLIMSTCYEIQLGKPNFGKQNSDPWEIDYVKVKKRDRDNRQSFTEFETNYEGAVKVLKEDLKRQKVSISLKIEDNVDILNGRGNIFSSQFGHLVVDLDFIGDYSLSLNSFCKLLLQSLPNLKELNLAGLWFADNPLEDKEFSPNISHNQHRKLTKISFDCGDRDFYRSTGDGGCIRRDGAWNATLVGKFLEIFPELEKIEEIPVQLIKAVVQARKVHALKSLSNGSPREIGRGDIIDLTYLIILAKFRPELTTFVLYTVETETSNEDLRGLGTEVELSLFSILQSSRHTLKSLIMTPLVFPCDKYKTIPRMSRLKSLQLIFSDRSWGWGNGFFPSNVSLQEIFPNVSEFSFSKGYSLGESCVEELLPASVFSPWGSQIKQLRLEDVSADSLQWLQRLFPNIDELQLEYCLEKAKILPRLSDLWPDLKILTLHVDREPVNLDLAFTGISEEIGDQLLDPTRREKFTEAEIQGFKDRSIICKLKGLKELKLIFGSYYFVSETGKMLTRLTPVSNEFGFELLQQLKVILKCEYSEEFKKELEPLSRSDNIEIIVVRSRFD